MLNNLQVLRAVAAYLVVLTHIARLNPPLLDPWLSFGMYGVDLFFVISGFVMVYTTTGKTVTPMQFMRNRIVRIVPMYWALTLAVFALALIAPSLLQATRPNVGELLKSLFFIPFVKSNGLVQPVLFLGWTLNYEMFFYLLFALSLFLASLRLRVLSLSGVLVGLVIAGALLESSNIVADFYTSPLLLEFMFGMLLGLGHRRLKEARVPALLCGAVIILGFGLMFAVGTLHIEAPRWLVVGLPAALIVMAALMLEGRGHVYRGGGLLLVGAASYMLYLSHPFSFIPIEKLAERFQLTHGPVMFVTAAVEIAVVTAVAIAIHLWIERPVTSILRRSTRPSGTKPAAADRMLWPWRLGRDRSGGDKPSGGD